MSAIITIHTEGKSLFMQSRVGHSSIQNTLIFDRLELAAKPLWVDITGNGKVNTTCVCNTYVVYDICCCLWATRQYSGSMFIRTEVCLIQEIKHIYPCIK